MSTARHTFDTSARVWARRNLFRTWYDAIITVIFGGAAIYVVYRMLRYVLITGRWEIVRVNLKLLLVGRFPDDELWKVVRRYRGPRAVGRSRSQGSCWRASAAPVPTSAHRVAPIRRARELVGRSGRRSSRSPSCSRLSHCCRTVDHRRRRRRCRRFSGGWLASPSVRRLPGWPTAIKALFVLALAATPIALDRDAHQRPRLGRVGRVHDQHLHRRGRDRAVLPARRAARAGAPLHTAVAEGDVHRVHRGVPRLTTVRAAAARQQRTRVLRTVIDGAGCGRAGHRRVHAVHRRLPRRDRPRRAPVGSARSGGGRQGAWAQSRHGRRSSSCCPRPCAT